MDVKSTLLQKIALTGILLLALGLRLVNIGAEGFSNLYYAATVLSMRTSWSNFFFGSFDPAGFVTVDKPPLAFWVQTISTFLFGFNGWALLLPQIIAGTLSCLVLYQLVRRLQGANAGLLAALILAVTPIAVAADRNSTMDAQLVLVLLLAAGALMRSVERRSLGWLLASAALVGLGFNIKMLQAFMVMPALYGFYLLAARVSWKARIGHLLLSTLVLAAVSLAWVVVVDLTPAALRPYIGSSQDNTVSELVMGHNGVKRLGQIAGIIGLQSGPGGSDGRPGLPSGQAPQGSRLPPSSPSSPPAPPGLPPGAAQGGPTASETGEAGLLRLFNAQLVGQASWLLPLALVMIAVLPLRERWTWPLNPAARFVLFWGLWLVPQAVFFSFAGLFHRYYLVMLAPAVAALAAAGIARLSEDLAARRPAGWLLPAVIAGSAALEIVFVATAWRDWAGWLGALMAGLAAASAAGLMLLRSTPAARRLFLALGLAAILAAPAAWAVTPVLSAGDAALPFAGPELLQPQREGRTNSLEIYAPLAAFLVEHHQGETFLAAAADARTASPLILLTGQAVMAMGGFTGSDPILTPDDLRAHVAAGELRFVLIPAAERGQSQTLEWVRRSCQLVPPRLWASPAAGQRLGQQLAVFECR